MSKTGRQYAGMIWRQAWSKTWAETRSATAAVSIVLGAVGLLMTIAPDTRTRLTLVITIGLLAVFLLYRLCFVSYHAYADLEERNEENNRQLADKMEHQVLADELTEQHKQGKKLLRSSERAAIDAWVATTLAIMRRHECSPQELHHVESIEALDVVGTHGLHGLAKFVFVRTQRIAEIATRHAEIAEGLGVSARKAMSEAAQPARGPRGVF